MNKWVFLFTLAVGLIGCAGWETKYSRIGELATPATVQPIASPEEIAIYVDEYPAGFIVYSGLVDETVLVEPGSKHKVLGRISVKHGMYGIFLNPLSREEMLSMLRKKASEVGANAIIGVRGLTDKGLFPLIISKRKYSGASGLAVIIFKE